MIFCHNKQLLYLSFCFSQADDLHAYATTNFHLQSKIICSRASPCAIFYDSIFQSCVSLTCFFLSSHEAWVNCNELWLELSESSLPTSASWSKIRGQTTKFIPLPTIINQSTLQKMWSAITKTPEIFINAHRFSQVEIALNTTNWCLSALLNFKVLTHLSAFQNISGAGLLFLCSVLSALRFKDKIPPHPLGQHIEIWCHSLIFAMFWKESIHLIHILIEPVLIIKMILTAES